MHGRPKIEEQYKKGSDVINFVVYNSTTGAGEDEVLQHKLLGTTETAHVTLHPDGSVNFRIKRSKTALENAIRTSLNGYTPVLSIRLKQFITKVSSKI
ncbi:MAG: hypothetical protein KDF59_07440 [Nitrosomonas sp.]|nr:hypothetical protein [Nitrosomonas sp.]